MNGPVAIQTQQHEHLLSSWKEIASFLGKGVRTVQRWESCLSLPVHRPSGSKGVVLAYPAEINAWCQKQWEGDSFAHNPRLAAEARPAESWDVLRFVLELAYSCAELSRKNEELQCQAVRGKPVASSSAISYFATPAKNIEQGRKSVRHLRSTPRYKSVS
jgi:hypothetical protein